MVMRWRRRETGQNIKELRHRCEERVRAINLPDDRPLTVHDVCECLGQLYGRPIHVVLLTLPVGSPDGLLVSADDRDFIVVEERLAPIHQHQVMLHELGHFICDHEAMPVMTPEASRLLLPSLDPELVHRVLGRDHSHSEAEQEAEYVGSIIGRQISTWTTQRTLEVPPEAQELVARLAALEKHPPHSR
ncbi:ImmA/IrrE family metallo-endopeptidase [Streptomyces sp. ME19-01-6]|uniref:ImmA/IrrE family metallo-endopeptidase n=1 Tax=Streptomyces sp. ME19-01-6 TaxID=3028686 RepID=UPI0039F4EB57